jgi:beta-glucosidase
MCGVDPFAGAEVAQQVAEQSIVLLKNAEGRLPLDALRLASIAVIGSHADAGVLSGWGSDQVDPAGGNAVPAEQAKWRTRSGKVREMMWHRSAPLKAIRAKTPDVKVEFDSGEDPAAAARLAARSTVAIVFVHQYGHEEADLADLSLPEKQDALVAAVAAANSHTIVVIESNSAITMPWLDNVEAVLAAWYPGIRGAEAIANVLFGVVNPSAKLTVTFPRSEADLPLTKLPGLETKDFTFEWPEKLKVGYKWYEAEGKTPLFPFGFGLSYTTYAYSDLKVVAGKEPRVSFNITNTGRRAGTEIAQVYATLPAATGEPFKRLVAWERVQLNPGETKSVSLPIERFHLSIFNAEKDRWELLPGEYGVFVGGSSRDLPLRGTVQVSP